MRSNFRREYFLALRDHDEDRVALALEHLQLGHCVAVHGQELHLFPSLHLIVNNLILHGSLDADAFKTNVGLRITATTF